jgi:hypothetical protein
MGLDAGDDGSEEHMTLLGSGQGEENGRRIAALR